MTVHFNTIPYGMEQVCSHHLPNSNQDLPIKHVLSMKNGDLLFVDIILVLLECDVYLLNYNIYTRIKKIK